MFGIFKKKTRKAITEVKKMENRDAVEATVWGAYSIAYADGTCDAKEIAVVPLPRQRRPAIPRKRPERPRRTPGLLKRQRNRAPLLRQAQKPRLHHRPESHQ